MQKKLARGAHEAMLVEMEATRDKLFGREKRQEREEKVVLLVVVVVVIAIVITSIYVIIISFISLIIRTYIRSHFGSFCDCWGYTRTYIKHVLF